MKIEKFRHSPKGLDTPLAHDIVDLSQLKNLVSRNNYRIVPKDDTYIYLKSPLGERRAEGSRGYRSYYRVKTDNPKEFRVILKFLGYEEKKEEG